MLMQLTNLGKHTWLLLSILSATGSYWYSRNARAASRRSYSVEREVAEAMQTIVELPPFQFRKVVIGINANVDLIVQGTELMSYMNATPTSAPQDNEVMNNLRDFSDTFAHFFSEGAPSERYLSDLELWTTVLSTATISMHHSYRIGGNAALMGNKIAAAFPSMQVTLVGPVGPRSTALLHSRVISSNSTRIAKDEVHLIMEYKQGEIYGEFVAPRTSRFIANHDMFSGSQIVLEMFFNAIHSTRADLVILCGLHLLEHQPPELWREKLRLVRSSLKQLPTTTPIHLQIGSTGKIEYATQMLNTIVPLVDSIGLNEQELAFLSQIGHGPYADQYPVRAGTIHVHKAVDIIFWLLQNYGKDKSDANKADNRLQRIHFHTLTYHILAVRGSEWSNLAASVGAGAIAAFRESCDTDRIDSHSADLIVAYSFPLDKELGRVYTFNAHSPMASWMRQDVVFIFTPVLVCKNPVRSTGIDDAIAGTALMYSQYYKFGMTKH